MCISCPRFACKTGLQSSNSELNFAGVADGFWEYRLKPWDVAAGVLMVREAGGLVTDMEGKPYSVFSRSTLATNGAIHNSIVSVTGPKTTALAEQDDLSPWFIPPGYEFETQ